MDYELAKELKNQGFPQATGGFYYWNRDLTEGTDMNIFYDDRIITHTIKVPTLGELIEACGNDFNSLERNSSEGNIWCANGNQGFYKLGSTPEEAITKLWLELNKK